MADDAKEYESVPTSEKQADQLHLKQAKKHNGDGYASILYSKAFRIGCLIFALIIFAVVIVIIALKMNSEKEEPVKPEVIIDCYKVEGVKSKDAYIFRGIPYAEPPVGDLRWRPPKPIQPGTSTCDNSSIEASTFSDMCAQASLLDFKTFSGSEDCLYLNVWTPTLNSSEKLPVMVWIHGGYLLSMDGNTPTYSPDAELAVETNMVYVSMNYRLNAFGFMALDILSDESETKTSGNYGFRDQIVVLEWVQRNIAAFGGNPNRVTLFGQSSGGTSINALLAIPKAKGLFHAAWSLSSSPIFNKTLEDASHDNLVFLEKTNCTNTTCLRNLSTEEVVEAIPWHKYPFWAMADLSDLPVYRVFDGALPVIDGELIPKVPITAWKNGEATIDVPVIIGDTAQETDLMPVPLDVKTWNKTQYENYVRSKLDTFGPSISDQALKLYAFEKGSNPEYLLSTMTSDARVICATHVLAQAMAKASGSVPVYVYVATARPTSVVSYFGMPFKPEFAFHGIDIFAYFGSMKDYYTLEESDKAFKKVIRDEIIHFAKTGKVSSPEWLPFPNSTAIINSTLTIADTYQKERCAFWMSNEFFSYAWPN